MAVNQGIRPFQPRGPPFHDPGIHSNLSVPHYVTGANTVARGPPPSGAVDSANQQDYSAKAFEFRELDAKRLRKSIYRKTVDYFTPVVKYLEERSVFVEPNNFRDILADSLYYSEMLPPVGYPHNASNAITTKFIRQATNKIKCPVFVTLWTPDGRRLVTGSSSGEFTLWNGLTFNFETILQAHDSPIRSMVWSRSDTWLVTGDANGYIKYWQANMNNVKSYQAHRDSIRGITFCPTDFKFATGSDDGTIRIWDFDTCETIKVLKGGHGGEVKCVDWHPKKSLLVTGSRDNQQPVKLWDPRTADSIGTLYLHKGPVTDLKWNPINSNYLLSSSRDTLVKLFDLRTMKDFQTCRGHKREVMSLAWHPIHQSHFCSGGIDGSLVFWSVGTEREVGVIDNAHDGSIWSMSWHPQGHILVTGSNDCSVKFWTRNRPGDPMKDKYNNKVRGDSDGALEIHRSEIMYDYEDEEEAMADPSRAGFDIQDITEFESNAPRVFRPPAPSLPPQFPPQSAPFGQPRPLNPSNHPPAGFQPNHPRGFPEQQGPRFPFRPDAGHPNQPPPSMQQQHQVGFRDDPRLRDNQFRENRYDERPTFHNRPPGPGDKPVWNAPKPDNQPTVGGWDNRPNKEEWRYQGNPLPTQTGLQSQSDQDPAHQGPPQQGTASESSPADGTPRSAGLLPAPSGGPRPPPPFQNQQPPPDYRRGEKRPWEPVYDERYPPQEGDRREDEIGGFGGEGYGGPSHGPPDRRDFRPRGGNRGDRGAPRRGGWRGRGY